MTEQGLAARLEALESYHKVRWRYNTIERSFYIFAKNMKEWRRKYGGQR